MLLIRFLCRFRCIDFAMDTCREIDFVRGSGCVWMQFILKIRKLSNDLLNYLTWRICGAFVQDLLNIDDVLVVDVKFRLRNVQFWYIHTALTGGQTIITSDTFRCIFDSSRRFGLTWSDLCVVVGRPARSPGLCTVREPHSSTWSYS